MADVLKLTVSMRQGDSSSTRKAVFEIAEKQDKPIKKMGRSASVGEVIKAAMLAMESIGISSADRAVDLNVLSLKRVHVRSRRIGSTDNFDISRTT